MTGAYVLIALAVAIALVCGVWLVSPERALAILKDAQAAEAAKNDDLMAKHMKISVSAASNAAYAARLIATHNDVITRGGKSARVRRADGNKL